VNKNEMKKMFECSDGTSFPIDDVVKISVDDSCPSKKHPSVLFVDADEFRKICEDESRLQEKRYEEYREKRNRKWKRNKIWWLISWLWDRMSAPEYPHSPSLLMMMANTSPMGFESRSGMFIMSSDVRLWRVVTRHNAMTISNRDYEKLKKLLDQLKIHV